MNLQLEESYDKNKFTRDQEIAYYQKMTLVDIMVTLENLEFQPYINLYKDAEEYLACEGILRADYSRVRIINEVRKLIDKITDEYDLQETS